MKIRSVGFVVCRVIAGAGSLWVSAYGAHSFGWADLRQDTFVVGLFCALPIPSFPVFLLSFKSPQWSVALHWMLAIGYLAVYSLLDWRTCAELGYCQGVTRTVLTTLTARPVEAVFAVAILNLAALLIQDRQRPRGTA
jgi:ABC-type uncharacterized transport system YnjBCD permease subunit